MVRKRDLYYNSCMLPATQLRTFAGTGRRFLAFAIDVIFLNIVFGLLFLIFWLTKYDYSEPWMVYFVIFIVYFGIGDSVLFNGQTIGKHKLKIQLVDFSGKPTGAGFCLGRAFYVGLLYFNYHILTMLFNAMAGKIPDLITLSASTFVIAFIFFSLTVFTSFSPYYQGFHDVIFKSIIIHKNQFDPAQLESCFDLRKLFAGYFFTFVLTLIVTVIAVIVRLILG